MSREILDDIINDFSPEKFIQFFREKNRAFAPRQEQFIHYNDASFSKGCKIGEIQYSETEKLLICAFKAGQPLSERGGKKAQYEKGKKILKESHFDAGIFIFYDTPGNFRFSLIYDIPKEKGHRDWSSFRRFTYFVSSEFTNKTFLQRIGDSGFPSLDKIKDAFSVEKVTKEFYEAYRKLFEALVADLNKNRVFQMVAEKNQINTVDFAKKLLGQIVFLYFLQKKGWLGVPQDKPWGEGDKNFVSNLYKQAATNKENYYNDYLEILFYDTLNNTHREGADPSFSEHFKCRIPFLNGGLFEPEYDWRGTKIYLENSVFGNIFDVFDRYNFTVEEDSLDDKEVAVDPEMLGKVFENLLEENLRKGRGTYYTPREIVHYMCQESLVNYLKTASGLEDKAIRSLVLSKTSDKLTEDDSKKLNMLLADIKICDPACGSGAFLVGMLHEIISARLILNPCPGEYGLKKEAIQNCIYGVDIDPGAVEIAKLRLWLSLVVDYDLADIEPLPNLDYKVMCGNSLLEELIVGNQTIKLFDERLLNIKTRKKDLLFEAAAGSDGQSRTGRREYLQKALQEKQGQLMKLHASGQLTMERKREFEREITLIDKELNPRVKKSKNLNTHPSLFQEKAGHYFEVLRDLHKKYFNEYDADRKKVTRSQIESIELEFIESSIKEKVGAIEDQIRNLNMQSLEDRKKLTGLMKKKLEYLAVPGEIHRSKTRPYFLWYLNFFEIFQDKGGFDVVMANPPYIGESGHKELFRKTKEGTLGIFYLGKMDYFYFFFHLALNLAGAQGEIAFITTNYYLTAAGARKLRTDFKRRAMIRRLINFNELRIFESALGQHNIVSIMRKSLGDEFAQTCITNRTSIASPQVLNGILSENDDGTQYYKVAQADLYDGTENYMRLNRVHSAVGARKPTIHAILDKVAEQGEALGKIAKINQGVVSGCDYVSPRNEEKLPANTEAVRGDGIFVFDLDNPRDKRVAGAFSEKEKKLLRKFYKNSDITRYVCNSQTAKRLLYIGRDFDDLSEYPKVLEHMKKFRSILEKRREVANGVIKYFQLQWPRDQVIFTGPKIVVPYRSNENAFAYSDTEWFCRSDCYVITQKYPTYTLAYFLALLNSKLYFQWLFHRGKRKGKTLEMFQIPLSEIPIKRIDDAGQKEFIKLTDSILTVKAQDERIDTSALERKIDQMVYKLYGLTKEEIKIVEGSGAPEVWSTSVKPSKSKSHVEKARVT